ncbi:MAG: sulfurtransferase TusA family protein [Desulfurococcales archaeon]|jgi:tRNA 2-thiouridine synthesizing protein A|nr:sulfurtransferase TusA family protein [Desulfurococcales archaeon]
MHNVEIDLERVGEGRYRLDARGYMCPYPQIFTLKAIEKIEEGSILEVLIDNPLSCENVPAVARKNGHDVLSIDKIGEGEYRISIRKRGGKIG